MPRRSEQMGDEFIPRVKLEWSSGADSSSAEGTVATVSLQ
jgi:hypothetical protein